ncbi:hypothetical protein [Sphingomonas sp. DC1600-2]|uniref:hypothetical protein n=1 Tax=unclassified Sphingomonas TaxID=196159 RepID=UPI003CE80548
MLGGGGIAAREWGIHHSFALPSAWSDANSSGIQPFTVTLAFIFMPNFALPASLLLALASTSSAAMAHSDGVALAQLTIHQRIIIRIPRVLGGPASRRSEPAPPRVTEKKGPKCVAMAAVEGALISGDDSVDLILIDDTRLRARFDNKCPALDFYSGLYLKATPDGMVCAGRDSIRARSGSACRIDTFKRLITRNK